MSLEKQIRDIAVQEIENLSLDSLYIGVSMDHQILTSLRDLEVISNEDIETALGTAVLLEAKKDFEYLLITPSHSKQRTADSLGHNEFLAYALSRSFFSLEETDKIPFDNGQNATTYIMKYSHENLLSELREKLLNPRII